MMEKNSKNILFLAMLALGTSISFGMEQFDLKRKSPQVSKEEKQKRIYSIEINNYSNKSLENVSDERTEPQLLAVGKRKKELDRAELERDILSDAPGFCLKSKLIESNVVKHLPKREKLKIFFNMLRGGDTFWFFEKMGEGDRNLFFSLFYGRYVTEKIVFDGVQNKYPKWVDYLVTVGSNSKHPLNLLLHKNKHNAVSSHLGLSGKDLKKLLNLFTCNEINEKDREGKALLQIFLERESGEYDSEFFYKDFKNFDFEYYKQNEKKQFGECVALLLEKGANPFGEFTQWNHIPIDSLSCLVSSFQYAQDKELKESSRLMKKRVVEILDYATESYLPSDICGVVCSYLASKIDGTPEKVVDYFDPKNYFNRGGL